MVAATSKKPSKAELNPTLPFLSLAIAACTRENASVLGKSSSCKQTLEVWAEIAGRGEELPEGLVKQLETAVEKVVGARQKEKSDTTIVTYSQQDKTMNGSGDNFELDDFDDLSNGSDSGNIDNLQDESLDLVQDVGKDVGRDLTQVSSCLKLLAGHAVAPTLREKESRQAKVVELLVNVLECHNHCSSNVLDLCIPIVSILAASPHLTCGPVEQLVEHLVKSLAAASVNKTKFHVPGIVA